MHKEIIGGDIVHSPITILAILFLGEWLPNSLQDISNFLNLSSNSLTKLKIQLYYLYLLVSKNSFELIEKLSGYN